MTPIDFQREQRARKNATQGMQDADTRLWVQGEEWGRTIRQTRKRRGWTLDRLSRAIYLDKGTIARYETGERACEYAVACQIADALGNPAIEQLAAQLIVSRLRGVHRPEVA